MSVGLQEHNDSNIDYSKPLTQENFQATLDRYPIGVPGPCSLRPPHTHSKGAGCDICWHR